MAESDRNQCPSYWATDPDTWRMWVNVLGPAAASKLAGACMSYFFDGTEPDAFKLTKQARAMFEGERGKLDRRRTSALNGAKRSRQKVADPEDGSDGRDVERSGSRKEAPKKSQGSPRGNAGKPAKNPSTARTPTSGNAKSRFKPIWNRNRNINPQTPAPTCQGARDSGTMSRAEFAALAGIVGFDTPNAYGMGAEIVAGG